MQTAHEVSHISEFQSRTLECAQSRKSQTEELFLILTFSRDTPDSDFPQLLPI